MSRFAIGNILSTLSRFIRQCKMNIQNCHFCKGSHVRCHRNWVQDFHLMLYLNSHFLLVKNTGKNADPYFVKPPSLSSTRECDDEPEGTLVLWFEHILFLPHQSNIMDHSWLLAMKILCKNKKLRLYVQKTFQAL